MLARMALGLIVLALAVLPFGRYTEIPLALLTFVGVYLLISRRVSFTSSPVKYYSWAFLLFFVPMLVALPDAVNFSKSLTTTLGSLRYYFAGLAIICLLGRGVGGMSKWIVLIMLVWALDAIIQLITGSNVFGYQYDGLRLNGMFGEDGNFKLGLSLVLFLPLALIWSLKRYSLWVTFLLAILLVAVVILSGNRSAWVITAVELGVLSLFLLRSGAMRWRQLLAGFTILVLSSVLVVSTNKGVQERTVDMIEAVERLDYQSIDKALSQRLEIWQAAVAMLSDNWFNGVGPRGFRYAYANYLENGDKHTANHDEQGRPLMHHAHQLILEVLCETGVVGLLGVLLLCLLLYHCWHHMPGDRLLALSFGAAVAGLLFPINSHLAFYSSYSAQLFWLLLALYFAAQAETQAQGSSQLKRS